MSGKLKDIAGEKYGRLTVISFSHIVKKHSYWKCLCSCGNTHIARSDCLKSGFIKSCGCLNKEPKGIIHNMAKSKLYHVWAGMKQRCSNTNNYGYERYGGRGINVCDEWANDFTTFMKWSFVNGYREGLSIDRINNDGNYEPRNCRWVNQTVQMNNSNRNRRFQYKKLNLTIVQWSKILNISQDTLYARLIKLGWDVEKALTTPPLKVKCNDYPEKEYTNYRYVGGSGEHG